MKDIKKQLPKGWRWGRLKNEITNNISLFKKGVFAEETFKYIDISSIDNVTKRIIGYQEIPVNDAPSRAKYILEENDIIVATVRPNLNAVAIVDKQYAGCVGSSGFCVVRLRNVHYPKYFFQYLTSPYFIDVVSAMVQGAMYPAINNHDVLNFEIPLPPTLDDQIAIANELERKMSEVETMRQAALRQKDAGDATEGAILREVFPPKEQSKLPNGWKWKKLSEVCFINPTKRKGFTRESSLQTTFVPMDAIDETTGRISKIITRPYSEISKGYTFFEEGDVLFAKITPCMQNGKSAIANNLTDKVGFGSTEFHVLRPKPDIIKKWAFFFVRTKEFRKQSEDHFEGSAGQQRVPVEFLENSLIPVPSTIAEQKVVTDKIEQKLSQVESIRQGSEKQLKAINAMPGAILREVFDFGKN